jgi:hypothetical protein
MPRRPALLPSNCALSNIDLELGTNCDQLQDHQFKIINDGHSPTRAATAMSRQERYVIAVNLFV